MLLLRAASRYRPLTTHSAALLLIDSVAWYFFPARQEGRESRFASYYRREQHSSRDVCEPFVDEYADEFVNELTNSRANRILVRRPQPRRRSAIISERLMGLMTRLLRSAIVPREFVSRFSPLSHVTRGRGGGTQEEKRANQSRPGQGLIVSPVTAPRDAPIRLVRGRAES